MSWLMESDKTVHQGQIFLEHVGLHTLECEESCPQIYGLCRAQGDQHIVSKPLDVVVVCWHVT